MKLINMLRLLLKTHHLKKRKTGRYAKTIFYFLRANPMNTAGITVTAKMINFGDGKRLPNPLHNFIQGSIKMY